MALAMAEIGTAASKGQAPSAAVVKRVDAAVQRAPLSARPFLVHGAIAQSKQDVKRAEQLFAEAARRDPRLAGARFFLAQIHLASGRPGEGLRHAAVLARLVAGGSATLAPAIAQYARAPGGVPTLRRIFAGDRDLGNSVLTELARDAGNFDLILALAEDGIGQAEAAAAPAWQALLLHSLVEKGDYARAHAFWRRISKVGSAPAGIFNPGFAKLAAPAPFNWTFGGGDFGFAEPAAGGGLQVMYYGRANAEFANQTLLLAPGSYELAMRVMRTSEGEGGSGLAWTVTCNAEKKILLRLPIGEAENGARSTTARFTVPTGCSPQTIRLTGTTREYAPTEQVTITNLELVRFNP
jgi:tetratricopeptide (TPR) repeat protein